VRRGQSGCTNKKGGDPKTAALLIVIAAQAAGAMSASSVRGRRVRRRGLAGPSPSTTEIAGGRTSREI
jgi:hypothetical protein